MNDPQILINGLNPLLVPCVGVLLTRTRTAHAVIVVRVRKVLQVPEALQRRKRAPPLSLLGSSIGACAGHQHAAESRQAWEHGGVWLLVS